MGSGLKIPRADPRLLAPGEMCIGRDDAALYFRYGDQLVRMWPQFPPAPDTRRQEVPGTTTPHNIISTTHPDTVEPDGGLVDGMVLARVGAKWTGVATLEGDFPVQGSIPGDVAGQVDGLIWRPNRDGYIHGIDFYLASIPSVFVAGADVRVIHLSDALPGALLASATWSVGSPHEAVVELDEHYLLTTDYALMVSVYCNSVASAYGFNVRIRGGYDE